MKVLSVLTLALSAVSTTAFVPQTSSTLSSSSLDACIPREEILKSPNTVETGKMWDPLGLAELGSDETIAWFRHSEIKHGRGKLLPV